MTLAVKRFLVAFGLGIAPVLVVVAVYWGLEALLASCADHDRGLWEGVAVASIFNGGTAIGSRVLRRVDAKKKEDPS